MAIKRLLGQLFDADAELFHLPDLTELILSQPLLGSTVKVDGHETDPYAFLTVMNMNFHKSHRAIKALREYFLTMTKQDAAFSSQLTKLLNADSKGSDVGLVLSERMINMPVQIAPPMYRMLNEEIEWANDDVSDLSTVTNCLTNAERAISIRLVPTRQQSISRNSFDSRRRSNAIKEEAHKDRSRKYTVLLSS